MRLITPATVHQGWSVVRRYWRHGTGVVAALLVVTTIAQPWRASGVSATPTADGAATKPPAAVQPLPARPAKPIAVTIPTTWKTPGRVPSLPWPRTGHAALTISGAGSIVSAGTNTRVPVASVAKSMTAYLILRDHPLAANSNGPTLRVTRAEAAAYARQVRLGQSLVPVRAGEALTERQALQALMLASADNIAQILARWDAGNVPAFLAKMNRTAGQLHMARTHYTDPSGYDRGTTSTVADQIHLADTAMKMPSFARIVSAKTAVIPVAGRISNYNKLLGQQGVVGIKTGSMSAAGGCLLFAARSTVAGRPVTVLGTVLGQRSNQIGDLHQAFASSSTLLRAVNHVMRPQAVVRAGQVVGKVAGTNWDLVATKDVTVVGWPAMVVHGTVRATVPASARDGSPVGTVSVDGGLGASVPVALHAHR